MSHIPMRRTRQTRAGQRGYSLIEVSVAIVISLFLLAGLFSILQTSRSTSTQQTLLAQLQDNQRIAMTLMQETLQSAGYYPNPLNIAPNAAFTVQTSPQTAFAAGQVLAGGSNTYGDIITVRFQSESTGSVLGCFGVSDTPVNTSHEYQFYIATSTVNGKATTSLYCARDTGTATAQVAALVDNVTAMSVTYGVDNTGSANGINEYVATANMSATDYLNVFSVTISLTFANPLADPALKLPGQSTAPASLVFTRVLNIMSRG